MQGLFVSDLHGRVQLYRKLFEAIEQIRPAAVFLGGDLLPSGLASLVDAGPPIQHFVDQILAHGFAELKASLGDSYPRVFLILGNDDAKADEPALLRLQAEELWSYAHNRRSVFAGYTVFGYGCVPPTPFQLKDWERYDVSRYVPPGAIAPEEGLRSSAFEALDVKYGTISGDLERLTGQEPLERAIVLFHAPPYQSKLDRAALDGKSSDHVPLDVHVGSIAIRRFIELRQPKLTLHGHVHESVRLTGSWRDRIGRTHLFSAAHDGPELALVRFDVDRPEDATRELL